MRRLRQRIILLGLLGGALYLTYEYGLNDEAKENLRKAVKAVEETYEQILQMTEAAGGQIMEDDEPLANVQATQRQWELLGY